MFAGSGEWDQTYAPTVTGGPVYATALQTDGKAVIGGAFTSVNGSSFRYHLARLYSDGTLDSTFFASGSGVSSTVWALAIQSSGSIVIGGDFTSVNGTTRTRIARLNANGTVDGSFVPTNTINNSVLAVAVQTNNAVIIGGLFSGSTFPLYNARLNADGTTDASFASYPNGAVYAIAIQPDGKIVIGGAFTTVNGAARYRIARLNSDGSLDNTFQNGLAGASSNVRCIQIQSDGKILIGGDFTTVDSTTRSYVARLTSTGVLDTGFNSTAGANGSVYTLAVQSDGNVLIGGSFSSYASANLSRVARLYTDGTRETTFTNFGINNIIQSLAVQSDGGILIGGTFTTINNTNWPYLGRLYGNFYPPEFVTQPTSRNTNVGANVTFSAQVSNPTATSFQWRKDGNNISGATGTSYSLFNVQLADAGNYSIFVNNAIGGITSSNALLQVGIAPAFTSQPASLTVAQGQSATFSVIATGTPLSYYWKKGGVFIPGQTNSSLTFASVVPTNAATYTCQVSNFLGNITSTGAVLTVVYPPTISVQPVSRTVGVGSNFTVSVTASGNPAVAYQWRTNGTPITGATATSYTVTGVQTNNSGAYDVIVTNSNGSVTSSIANITVIYYPPTIVQQPVGGNILVGGSFNLSATAYGTAPLAWQWRTNGTPIPSANVSNYAINSAQLSDTGSYDVIVTNSTGSVTSSVAILNVGYAPVVVQQPISFTNIIGGTNIFTCIVTGTVPINLQWTVNGNPIAGATNSILTLTNLQPVNIGYYALTATNLFAGTVSSNAALNLAGYNFTVWNGLVAYLPFNGNASDATGNGNNGTNFGAVLTADRFGNTNSAYSFDGSSAFIDFGSPADLAFTNNFTLSAWCLFNGGSQNPRIICYGQDSGYELLTAGTGSTRQFQFVDGTVVNISASYSQNTWYSVTAVVQNGTVAIYVNGVLDGINPVSAPTFPYNLQIGTKSQAGSDFWGGIIDDVRFYNRALSSNDVASLYDLEADIPVITQQPQSQILNLGDTANFSVIATANNPLSYQWVFNGNAVAGATNITLTIPNVQATNLGYYSVVVSNAVTGIASSNATLGLNYPPTIATQPVGGNIAAGNSFTLSAAANGTVPFSWQWRKDGSPLFGATGTNFLLNPVQMADAGSYDVVVTNFVGSVTSIVAVVNVGYAPVVVQQPLSVTNLLGESTSFSCLVTGTAPVSLQWTFYGSAIANATNSVLILTNLQPASIGNYSLTATNAFGGTASSNAALNLAGLYVLIQPSSIVLDARNFGLSTSRFSTRLAISGGLVAVGQALNGGVGGLAPGDSGLIHIFSIQSNTITKLNTIMTPDTVYDGANFGYSLGLSGNNLYAGCGTTWRSSPHDGTAYLYNNLQTSPALVSEWTEIPSQAAGYFGNRGSLVGDSLIVSQGANSTYNSLGGAFFYRVDANGNRTSVFSFMAPDTDRNVSGMSLSSNRCAVLWNSSSDSNNCQILVFDLQRDATNRFSGVATNTVITVTNFFGSGLMSTACDGDFVAVGEPQYAVGTNQYGRVRVWQLSGGSASLSATLFPPDLYSGGNYGECVYLKNNTLIVGSPTTMGISNAQGCVYVYNMRGAGQPASPQKLQPSSPVIGSGEYFGNPISWDGSRVIIGSSGGQELTGTGAVYIYDATYIAQQTSPTVSISNKINGILSLNLTGLPGVNYVLQSATNLTPPINWLPVLTNTTDTNGLWQFTDTNLNSAQKFYRATTP